MKIENDYYFKHTVFFVLKYLKDARIYTINKRDFRLSKIDKQLEKIEKELESFNKLFELGKEGRE